MIRVREFMCPTHGRFERFVDGDMTVSLCPKCDLPSPRVISAPRCKLDGTTGDFPGAAMQWERNRERHMAKERKHMADHGEYLNGKPCD
jgi:hypothetical protein